LPHAKNYFRICGFDSCRGSAVARAANFDGDSRADSRWKRRPSSTATLSPFPVRCARFNRNPDEKWQVRHALFTAERRHGENLALSRKKFLSRARRTGTGNRVFAVRFALRNKSCIFGMFAHDQNSTNPQVRRICFAAWPTQCSSGIRTSQFTTGDPGGTEMPNLFVTPTTEGDARVEKRLWQAVVVSTIQEWISGPLRYKRIAEEYLFQDRSDFPQVCQSAGLDVDRLRQQLNRLRTHSNPLGKTA
jgi:hypothetical protein